jgi:hypothetical protein
MKEKIILKGDIEEKYENVGATLISTGRYIRIIIYLIFLVFILLQCFSK